MRRDRGRLGVAVAYPLDPGAGSAAGAVRRPDALSDGRRGAGAGVPGGRRRGSGDPSPPHVQDRRGAPSAGGDEAAADPCRGDRGDPGFDLLRSCGAGQRQLEVRIGNVETASGRRQVFGAGAKTDTDLAGLIRRSLDAVGRTEGTVLTAFTDGCPGLRRILLDAGVEGLPILD